MHLTRLKLLQDILPLIQTRGKKLRTYGKFTQTYLSQKRNRFFQIELSMSSFYRYAKGYDPDNWLTIDENTGAIRMNKAPDRESKHLVNGTYYAKIFSITQGRFHC